MKTLSAIVCFLLAPAVLAEVPSYMVYCDPAEFDYMNENWQEEIEIDCIVVRADTIFSECRLRIRGDSSRWYIKKSYRITFSLTEPLDGRSEWNFNADYLDDSYMHTWLFSWVVRNLGYPCFDVNHVRLYVNDEYRGLYMRCEPIDEQFLLEHGIDPMGNLYKAALDGACLSIWDDVEAYWDKKTNRGQGYNDLYQLIADLEAMPVDDIVTTIGEIFNLNDLLTISAINYLTCNTSTYYHNYFLYHDIWNSGKWLMLPWDVDKTFWNVGWGYYTVNNTHWWDNPLQRKLFQDSVYLDLLYQRMESICSTVFNSSRVAPLIDSLQVELALAVEEDILDQTDLAGFLAASDSLRDWYVPDRLNRLQWEYDHICRPYHAYRGDSVGIEGLAVSWSPSYDPDGDPFTYNVMVTTDIWEPESIVVSYTGLTDTVCIIQGLEPGDYIWRVWIQQSYRIIEAYDRHNVFRIEEGTVLQGTLQGNTWLTYADSPYHVTGNIVIPEGSNLYIESGVQLRFADSTSLTCHGTLTASGMEQDSVIFCADIGSEPWKGILVDGAGGASLQYTVVSGTYGYGLGDQFAGLCVEDTDLQMEHCSFRDNVGCVKVNRGAVMITECDFTGGNTGELFFMTTGTGAIVQDSRFANLHDPQSGSYDGIEFQECLDGNFIIRRCEVYDIDGDCIDYNSSDVSSLYNVVHGAADKGFSIGESSAGGPDRSYAIMRGDIIYDCPIGIAVKDGSTAEVDGCTIVNCTTGISLYEKTSGYGGGICHTINSILYANTLTFEEDPLSSFDIAYSLSSDPVPLPGPGNISGDPEFYDYPGRDFHLRFSSPCIDSGDPDDEDPDGTRRDMGAIFFPQVFDQLYLNEIQSSNQTTIADAWGEYGDWFELYNAADWDADLSWVYMSDDPLYPDKWRFPSGTIVPSGGYVVVWADGEYWKLGLHMPWRLNATGDSLYMSVAEVLGNRTVVTLIDELVFGSIGQDRSIGRTPDGSTLWEIQPVPTPGSSNGGPGPYPGTLLVGNPFPNPCRIVDLAMDFEIDQGWTTVSVYDLSGRLVSVLDDRLMSEGLHRMFWNLEDTSGVPVPNGVYLILVEHTGAIPVSRKVVVLSRR